MGMTVVPKESGGRRFNFGFRGLENRTSLEEGGWGCLL